MHFFLFLPELQSAGLELHYISMKNKLLFDRIGSGHIHFIGCGGAGMCCLALIMKELGASVSGSDLKESDNTELLLKSGIPVTIGHSVKNLPSADSDAVIVRSAAVRADNPEFYASNLAGFKSFTRGEFLAVLASGYMRVVSIGGSHGKTSVTAMLVHVLKDAGLRPGFMIGGKVCGWASPAAAGDGDIFVTEADESDGSLTLLRSNIAVVTNIDDDHAWSVGGEDKLYANFAEFGRNSEKVLYLGSKNADSVLSSNPCGIRLDKEREAAKVVHPGWGFFQRSNASLAASAAVQLGMGGDKVLESVVSFPGVERRMSVRYSSVDFVLVEDYAHHPVELSASIGALREKFPDWRLRVVFQPHRQARLEKYIGQFACELRKADEVTVVPVFAAWSEMGPLSSRDLAIKTGKTAKFSDCGWEKLAEKLALESSKREVLAIIGAGDINELIPHLKSALGKICLTHK